MREVEVRTEYRTQIQRDSVYVDCTDTVFVLKTGDTVKVVEKQTVYEYRYKVLKDTLYMTDTVTVEKKTLESAETGKNKPIKRWRWYLFGFMSSTAIWAVLRILVKIYLKK